MKTRLKNVLKIGTSILKNVLFSLKGKYDKDVIVFTTEAIGDNLLFLDSFKGYERYAKENNRKLTILCGEKMKSFWLENATGENTEVVSVNVQNFKSFLGVELSEFLSRMACIRYDNVIVPMHHTTSLMLGAFLSAKRYMTIAYDEWLVNRTFLIDILYKTVYKDYIYAEKDLFIGQAFERQVNYFDSAYKWNIGNTYCSNIERLIADEYILVAPIASCADKSLSRNQITKIVEFLLKNTEQEIVLTANEDKRDYFQELIDEFKDNRLKNYAGKTSFSQYIQLVSDANFLIGCDSGSVHLAASLNTQSIALCGQWSGAYLPYKGVENQYASPRCFFSGETMKCQFCMSNKGGICSSNTECYEIVQQGHSRLCLEDVVLDGVFDDIRTLVKG